MVVRVKRAEIVREGLGGPPAPHAQLLEILFDNAVVRRQDSPFLHSDRGVPVPDLIGDTGKLLRRIGI